jgi:hypothetical protein
MKNGLRVLASVAMVGLQASPMFTNISAAQQVITIIGSTCPVNATCIPGSSHSGGGGGGYIPESEAGSCGGIGPAFWTAQANRIAEGIVMVCPVPGEPYSSYYPRAMSDCKGQVTTALEWLSYVTPSSVPTAACGLQASRIANAYNGQDTCK